jgi:chemotaxis protein MotB
LGKALSQLNGELGQAKDQIAALNQDKQGLANQLAQLQVAQKQKSNRIGELQSLLAHSKKQRADLASRLSSKQETLQTCETQVATTSKTQKTLSQKLKNHDQKISQVAERVDKARAAIQQKRRDRRHIAQKLIENLKAANIDVQVDPETGNVTLRMDDAFYFRNDSSLLKDKAKVKLSKLMPVYAQSLLGDPTIAKRISGVSVTGFASPKYRGDFIDPAEATGKAYEYNLELSTNRARSIVRYVFDDEINDYRYKTQMKGLVSVVGKGLMDPVPHEPESICVTNAKARQRLERCSCGPFDCKTSRRVEINFHLKDQPGVDKYFDSIADELNESEDVEHVGH